MTPEIADYRILRSRDIHDLAKRVRELVKEHKDWMVHGAPYIDPVVNSGNYHCQCMVRMRRMAPMVIQQGPAAVNAYKN